LHAAAGCSRLASDLHRRPAAAEFSGRGSGRGVLVPGVQKSLRRLGARRLHQLAGPVRPAALPVGALRRPFGASWRLDRTAGAAAQRGGAGRAGAVRSGSVLGEVAAQTSGT
jgi:hypothetical protein